MIVAPAADGALYAQVIQTARRFADAAVRPAAAWLDREAAFPADIFARMGGLGLFAITVPAEHGGAGLDTLAYALTMEELSRGAASVADQCGLVELVVTLLAAHGTAAQRAMIAQIAAARRRVAYCITEPGAGSDVSAIVTTARREGAGWRLDGAKQWIHNAPVADIGLVLARTDPAAGSRGMSIFVVDLNAAGVARGPAEKKLGQRASQIGGLTFDGVRLGPDALLGPEGRGFHLMMSVLEKGRVGIAALAVGVAQAGLEAALAHAALRRQFGAPLIEKQGLRWMLADMATQIEAARAMTHRAAMLLDAGAPANAACSMAKLFAADMAVTQVANAVQIFGASGCVEGAEVERLYRDAKITQIYEGAQQIQRDIIAREIAGRA